MTQNDDRRMGRPPIEKGERVVSRSFSLRVRDEAVIGEIMRAERGLPSRSAVVRVALELLARKVRDR